MTTIQLLYLAADIVQFAIGGYVLCAGYKMAGRKWDRTQGEYHTGITLMVLGAVIILLLRLR
jgi:hypothetical protein